ncbi:MAG: ABC transporter permease [Candidatus Cryptobacteroides sp.]
MWKYLLEKEFRQFFRDPMLPKIVIVFPVLMMLVFPFAANMEIRNINLVVVDSDRSVLSRELIEKCTESGYFRIVDICDDPAEAMAMMDKNTADAILTIEQGFSRDLRDGDRIPLGVKVNTVNGTKGSIGSQYLTNCIMLFMQAHTDASAAQAAMQGPRIEASAKYYYNQYMDYKKFMVPALIVIAVTMVTGFFPALNIVGEKQAGTIEQINVTPVKKTAFIICKLIPYWVITYFMIGICLLIAWLVFGYVCQGSLWIIMLFTLLHITVTAGLGLLVSNYSDNAQQAMFIMMFFVLIFMLMSGVFTPISSMPEWAQYITYANPLRYYADAMRSVFLKGSTFMDVWYDAAGLLAIGTLSVTWAILSYKKTN